MSQSLLPSPDEARALVPKPGSAVRRYAGDARLYAAAGYALLLQVSHPTVGAGVAQHSNFRTDPWGRLLRTLDFTYSMVYGSPQLAAETCARVRDMHKAIKGVAPDGRRYHALEPEAYAWVHATLAESIVKAHRHFARPMSSADVEEFWADWRRVGRLLGVREQDLPEGWDGFRAYFDTMVAERLEDNEAVHEVVDTLAKPAAPPLPLVQDGMWRMARWPAARLTELATIGLLPRLLRERLRLPWTRAQEAELRALGRLSRAATPLMPDSLLHTGPGYLRWRRKAIARGDVAGERVRAQLGLAA